MRGKNAATPKGNQKKSGSPGPSKARDRQGKGVQQKGQAADIKKKSDVNPDDVPVCEDCSTPIGGDVSALQCDNCDSIHAWKCTSCLGVSDELYQELMSNTDLKWFCRGCSSSTPLGNSASQPNNNLDRVLERMNQLVELFSKWEMQLVDAVRKEVGVQIESEFQNWKVITNQIEDRITQCEAKIALRVEAEHTRTDICGLKDEDWPGLGCSHTSKPVDQGKVRKIIQEAVNQQHEEDKEVEARRNNLVLYNIPENQSEKRDERLRADKDFIVTMCDDVAGIRIDDLDILKCIRLGAYSDDKVRPLLITMSDDNIRDGMLRMGKDLGLSGRRYSRIGIAPDLTPKQREENRKLLEEAKAAIVENGESPENYKLYVIRRSTRPEVIKRKRHKMAQRIQQQELIPIQSAEDQSSLQADN